MLQKVLILKAYKKTGSRDPSGTLAGPYKNWKTGIRDPSGTLEKPENRNPIIIIIIINIFYYHHFIFCWLSHNHYNIM